MNDPKQFPADYKFDPETGWFSARTEGDGNESIVIGQGSWLASGVTVTAGVKIGKKNWDFLFWLAAS